MLHLRLCLLLFVRGWMQWCAVLILVPQIALSCERIEFFFKIKKRQEQKSRCSQQVLYSEEQCSRVENKTMFKISSISSSSGHTLSTCPLNYTHHYWFLSEIHKVCHGSEGPSDVYINRIWRGKMKINRSIESQKDKVHLLRFTITSSTGNIQHVTNTVHVFKTFYMEL